VLRDHSISLRPRWPRSRSSFDSSFAVDSLRRSDQLWARLAETLIPLSATEGVLSSLSRTRKSVKVAQPSPPVRQALTVRLSRFPPTRPRLGATRQGRRFPYRRRLCCLTRYSTAQMLRPVCRTWRGGDSCALWPTRSCGIHLKCTMFCLEGLLTGVALWERRRRK
jgi:hypothetical protein